jgi:hypothetical protein
MANSDEVVGLPNDPKWSCLDLIQSFRLNNRLGRAQVKRIWIHLNSFLGEEKDITRIIERDISQRK